MPETKKESEYEISGIFKMNMERSDLLRRHSAVRQNLIIQHLHMQENGLGRWDIIHRWGRIVWWIRESGSATTRHYVAKN